MLRPVLGGCWGEARHACLRTQGDFQWHGYPDPVFVETCSCAQSYSHRGISELCTKQIRNLQCGASGFRVRNAVCRRSLPCVGMADERPGRIGSGRSHGGPLLSETMAAKEAKEADRLGGKTPRLCQRGRKGIAVRTKWQSGSVVRQRCAMAPKGEPPPSATRGAPWGKPTRT